MSARDTDVTIDWKKFLEERGVLMKQSIKRDFLECEEYWRNNWLKEISYSAWDTDVTSIERDSLESER